MDIFDVLSLIGGLCLFLFGMSTMGEALERRAGGSLQRLLSRLTTGKAMGLFTGLAVTAVIQSSSATTVMVVGFVNSGLMTLSQAVNVIMGANIGTTVTAWILSLSGIDSHNTWVMLLKPSYFTPVLALIGIIMYMSGKGDKRKDTGSILLGFATLMFGMEAMSGAVSGLKNVPEFANILLLFTNPVLGVLAGMALTAIIQSSSASVGILQALAVTGQVTYSAAIPIIMGQNIGTCVTAMLSSVGTTKNARRAALVHLMFNIIGTIVWLTVFCLVKAFAQPAILNEGATAFGIAIAHSAFNVLCTALLFPMSDALVGLVMRILPDSKKPESVSELDERLLAAPAVALERCREKTCEMAVCALTAINDALDSLTQYNPELAKSVRENEEKTDHLEDTIGTYLVKLSARQIGAEESALAARLLRLLGDFERMGDHALNILESAEELSEKKLDFSDDAKSELKVITSAVREITELAVTSFTASDLSAAAEVEPLEKVVDSLKEQLRARHICRMQKGLCSIDAGFVWSDVLTDLERVADHCSNIAGCVADRRNNGMSIHEYVRSLYGGSPQFGKREREYASKYAL